MKFPSGRQHAFTLIEILIVVAVMSLLLALTVPMTSSMLSASRLTNGGNMVTGLTASARQTAMSKNTMTALVLLAHQGTSEDGRAFTILEYTPENGWVQGLPWEVLPDGVVVDVSDETACTFMTNSPVPFPFLPDGQSNPPLKHRDAQVQSPEGYAARLFLPGGGLANAQTPAQIRLVEGHVANGAVVRAHGMAPANFYDITIIGDTGQIKIDRP